MSVPPQREEANGPVSSGFRIETKKGYLCGWAGVPSTIREETIGSVFGSVAASVSPLADRSNCLPRSRLLSCASSEDDAKVVMQQIMEAKRMQRNIVYNTT
mmetsp:Transcript_3618/g.8227  ORF Transcript_3618/g.8227 Transcript_3618/m.8227 type:complete len:101 (-) Transcript_3618:135-437(-)